MGSVRSIPRNRLVMAARGWWSRSLGACVVMHAVANLLMGLYAVGYAKYGLW